MEGFMLKIDRQKQLFTRLETPSLADASISERYDLQEYIYNSPEAFFEEIGQRLFLVAKEIQPSDDVEDRIDLLALDKEGNAVIIELKRGNHKLQMFQAISYAGMVATWEPGDFLTDFTPEQKEKLLEFLEVEIEEINRHQRIILVAEAFDYSVLIGAEWLNEKYDVDIVCCRIALARDTATCAEYLVCSNIFPAPEVAQQAVRRGRKRATAGRSKWSGWDAALAAVNNPAIVAYFRREIETKRDNYLARRSLRYRLEGKRRWTVRARTRYAYVAQRGRFEGDVDYWRAGLSQPDQVEPIADGRNLRFHLYTEQDCKFFHQAATQELVKRNWTVATAEEELDEEGDGQADETP
jgi:hypothetical protein